MNKVNTFFIIFILSIFLFNGTMTHAADKTLGLMALSERIFVHDNKAIKVCLEKLQVNDAGFYCEVSQYKKTIVFQRKRPNISKELPQKTFLGIKQDGTAYWINVRINDRKLAESVISTTLKNLIIKVPFRSTLSLQELHRKLKVIEKQESEKYF